ncbi:type I polyketide synthase [Amycolatopsis pigmentata]|uniref:SDR family NAD(P)-dependent oxidoreductase n=1 Tax=Amycolatopsis pigmentata TaxID=450801 RepID=A0ABW5G4H6_9PSEU
MFQRPKAGVRTCHGDTLPDHAEPTAVIGLSCRLPRAESPAAFWELLCGGENAVRPVPASRWGRDDHAESEVPDSRGSGVHRAGVVEDVALFDPAFFGISPREAISMDPQQRLALELGWEALEDAGIVPADLRGQAVGVFVGAMRSDYAILSLASDPSRIGHHTATGVQLGMIANRLSSFLHTRGPSLTVDTGQSSSLVAVHMACESLRRNESSSALVGGVHLNLSMASAVAAEEMGALSPDGTCYTFDARANGFVRGEGGAFVVLKPLSRAVADGDRVYCVIRGSATNNDGGEEGLGIPGRAGQEAVLRAACEQAGVNPGEVGYVELHGTGTRVGDPVEAAALGAVHGAGRGHRDALLVGSVKTNIGHLEGAAGIVGLVKTALAVRHRLIPASLNFDRPNPAIRFDSWHLRVVTELRQWPRAATAGDRGDGLIAGVSSFGMGGTNCHVVVSDAPPGPPKDIPGREREYELQQTETAVLPWVVSGHTPAATRAQASKLLAYLGERRELGAREAGYALAASRSAFGHRAVVIGGDREDLIGGLSAIAQGKAHHGVVSGRALIPRDGKVAFVFPGQGSQWAGMALELWASSPVFAHWMEACAEALSEWIDQPLAEAVADARSLESSEIVQPVLWAVMVSLAEMWKAAGIRPDAVVGHSQGEIAAACVARSLSLRDGARIVALRARVLTALSGRGAMAVLPMSKHEATSWAGGSSGITVAAMNSPATTVVAGDTSEMDELLARLAQRGISASRVAIDYASHTRQVEAVRAEVLAVLSGVEAGPAEVPFYSTVTGAEMDTHGLDGEYWYANLRQPVLFEQATRELLDAGFNAFVEVSAHPVLTSALGETFETVGADACAIGSLRRQHGGIKRFLHAVAELHVHGMSPDWTAIFPRMPHRGDSHWVDLPTYAFQRRHYWLDRVGADTKVAAVPSGVLPRVADQTDVEAVTGSALRDRLVGLDSARQNDLLTGLVSAETAAVLGLDGDGPLDVTVPFKELGFDSVMMVELRGRVNAVTGLRLPPTSIFDHPSVKALVAHLHRELTPDDEGDRRPVGSDTTLSVEDDPVVIVGMACRFPGGVDSPEGLWRLVASGGEGIGGFPTDRGWDMDGVRDLHGDGGPVGATPRGGFLHDVADFDAAFFGISPNEALAMDPQQRLLLETSWEALERSGIDPLSLPGTRTGVFVGAMDSNYRNLTDRLGSSTAGYALTGAAPSVLSGRLSYSLGVQGPALTVDTACSSSLVALHLAARSLRAGECSIALAAGVTVMATPTIYTDFARLGGLSRDGRCKAFSDTADGTSWSEGVGVLVVERMSVARRQGRRIWAVLRASAMNSDGASNGLTAPNGMSQQRLIRDALGQARLTASDVDVVEAHGTGTALGDPIEAQALLATYGQGRAPGRPLWLGTVKSNLGHTQAAAGIAGVIKMVMAMRYERMPRTLHVDRPSTKIDWTTGDVRLLTESRAWPGDRPRRAAVSSFGISGTNAHVIIEQAPVAQVRADTANTRDRAGGPLPWVVSGRNPGGLRVQAARLLTHLRENEAAGQADVGLSLITTRAMFDHRAVVVGEGRAELLAGLTALARGETVDSLISDLAVTEGKTVFVFPGQGSQWVGMASQLMARSPAFAKSMSECEDALASFVDWSLIDVVTNGGEAVLSRVDVVQPALWAVMVSLAAVWSSFGVTPAAVLGHSQGEIAAACVAGALSLEDGARVVALRSQALKALAGRGGMLSVSLPAEIVQERLERYGGDLSIAVINSPRSVVVSGENKALSGLCTELTAEEVHARRIEVDYASHSGEVDEIEERLLAELAPLRPGRPRIPWYSTVDGTWIDMPVADARYWFRNLRQTVRFAEAVGHLSAEGYRRFVEVSPHPVLVPAMEQTLDPTARAGDIEVTVGGTLARGHGGLDQVLRSVAAFFVSGGKVDWTPAFENSGAEITDLPTYPFERRRFWPVDAVPAGQDGIFQLGWVESDLPRRDGTWPRLVLLIDDSDGGTAVADSAIDGTFQRFANLDALARAWDSLTTPPDAVVTTVSAQAGVGTTDEVHRATAHVLAQLQTWLADDRWADTKLVVATSGAVTGEEEGAVTDLVGAAVWGLVRSAQSEHPDRFVLADFGPRPGLNTDVPVDFAALALGLALDDEPAFAVRDGRLRIPRIATPRWGGVSTRGEQVTAWDPDGTVLITGGVGGVGSILARHLVRHGRARHLLLTSRSGERAAGASELVAELTELGADVRVEACDVGDRAAVARLIAGIGPQHPLTAVIHLAAVFADAMITSIDTEKLDAALRPKVDGGWHLHDLTRELDLSAFLLFSSVADTFGFARLGHYAAGNAYLDALASYRRGIGLPAVAMAWGPWTNQIGMRRGLPDSENQRTVRSGTPPLSVEQGLSLFDAAVTLNRPEVLLTRLDMAAWRDTPGMPSVLRSLAGMPTRSGSGRDSAASATGFAERLAPLDPKQRSLLLLDLVSDQTTAILGRGEPVRPDRTFRSLGLDSLGVIELRNRLAGILRIRLPVSMVYDHPTPESVSAFLLDRLSPSAARAPARDTGQSAPPRSVFMGSESFATATDDELFAFIDRRSQDH